MDSRESFFHSPSILSSPLIRETKKFRKSKKNKELDGRNEEGMREGKGKIVEKDGMYGEKTKKKNVRKKRRKRRGKTGGTRKEKKGWEKERGK